MKTMYKDRTRKLCFAAILCAVAVVGSLFSVPIAGSKNLYSQDGLGVVKWRYGVQKAKVLSERLDR